MTIDEFAVDPIVNIKDALSKVPEEYHEAVARELTHDINVILRTIDMVRQAG